MKKHSVMSPAEIAATCSSLKSLANENRLSILFLLMDGDWRTVNTVARETGIAQSTASEQLKLMREQGGFLVSRREGKEVYYCADNDRILDFLDRVRNHLKNCCPE